MIMVVWNFLGLKVVFISCVVDRECSLVSVVLFLVMLSEVVSLCLVVLLEGMLVRFWLSWGSGWKVLLFWLIVW